MPLHDWIDLEYLKICTRHTVGSLVAMTSSKVTAFAADVFLDEETLRVLVHGLERVVLVGLLLWLVCGLAVLLWRHRV
jgi:hypothetical protein